MSNGHNKENNSGGGKHHEDNNRDGDKHDDDHGDDHDDDCTPVIVYIPGPEGPTVHEHHHHEIINHIEVIEYVEVEVEVPVYIEVEVKVEVPVPGPTEYITVEVPGPAGPTVYIEVEVPGPATEGGWNIIDTGQHNNQVPVPDANEGLPLDVIGSTVVATGFAWTVAKFLGKKLLARAGEEAKDVKEALL